MNWTSVGGLGKIAFDASRKRAPLESSRSSGRSLTGIANAKVAASRKCKPGPRRAVGKLVRTDDGTGTYQSDGGQHSTFLLHSENDPSWKQYSRVRHVFITIVINIFNALDSAIHQRLCMSYCFYCPHFLCPPPPPLAPPPSHTHTHTHTNLHVWPFNKYFHS